MSPRNKNSQPARNKPSSNPGASPAAPARPAGREQAVALYGSYGVKRSVAAPPPPPARPPRRRGPRLWLWLVALMALALFSFGVFSFVRVSTFVDNSFSGRNEASLLEPTTTPARRNIAPTTDSNSGVVVRQPTATPRYAGDPVRITPVVAGTPTASPAPVSSSLPAIIQKIKQGLPVTALLVGYGGGQHDGANLTDTILLLTYEPANNAVTMVNLPRDLYVFIPAGGPGVGFWSKINAAFARVMDAPGPANLSPRYRFSPADPNSRLDAAVNLLKDVVEQVTAIPVDYWATFSFEGFRKFVDAIGGVPVNVETAFTDYEYPANDNSNINPGVMTIHFEAGPQRMNGERAIQYARSRKSSQDGSDFNRSRRQMKLIQGVKEQVARPEIMLRAFGMMDALQGNIRTSLGLNEARALMEYFQGEGAAAARNLLFVPQILSGNFLSDATSSEGAYILVPLTGQGNYSAIQDWLRLGRQFPQVRAEGLKVQIQNGSGLNSLARQVFSDLESGGLELLQTTWASPISGTVILDYTGGKAVNTLQVISRAFPAPVPVRALKRPAGLSADVIVLLGSDPNEAPALPGPGQSPGPNVLAGGLITPTVSSRPARRATPTPTPVYYR